MNSHVLPSGWDWAPLEDLISAIETGKSFKCEERPPENGEVGVAKVSAVTWGRYREEESKTCIDADRVNPALFIHAGDFLFSRANTIELVGACVIATDVKRKIMLSDKILRLVFVDDTLKPWVLSWLRSKDGRRQIESLASGNQESMRNIAQDKLRQIMVPVPPDDERLKIISLTDELFSHLNAGVAELKVAQRKLTQNRQSLLKEALTGALTARWRVKNSPSENGAQLLERALVERRTRWEAKQLARFRAQGKPPRQNWQKKYPPPVQPETAHLPPLPESWVWASLDMLGDIASGVAKGTSRSNDLPMREVPYLRVANVQRGYLDLSDIKTIMATEHDIEELQLRDGDVLFNEGGDRDKLGRGWVWRNEVDTCIHQNHVFRMRPYLPETEPELISHHGNTFGKLWFENLGKQTTNLASINMTVLRAFPVPVAPAEEQREIASRIAGQLDAFSRQGQAIAWGLKQADAQRQNILRDAFTGRLVRQDPSAEPATSLLQRIRAERAGRGKPLKQRMPKATKEISVIRRLEEVLKETGDWMPAQEAFRRCGVADGSTSEEVEAIYTQLRVLDKAGHLQVKSVNDAEGRKLYDVLKLTVA